MLRRLLERISRRVVLRRRLPGKHGGARLFVSPSCSLRLWLPRRLSDGLFDIAALVTNPGDVIWDCGANIGLFGFPAALAAGPSGKVVCIEPDPFCVDLLLRSAADLPAEFAEVHVLNAAAADELAITKLMFATRGASANHLASVPGTHTSQAGNRGSMDTITHTLDSLLAFYPPPAVIKIDVEGAEALVLAGATRLLEENRPVLVLECEEYNASTISAVLCEAGYVLHALTGKPPYQLISKCEFNTLCVPKEKISDYQERGALNVLR